MKKLKVTTLFVVGITLILFLVLTKNSFADGGRFNVDLTTGVGNIINTPKVEFPKSIKVEGISENISIKDILNWSPSFFALFISIASIFLTLYFEQLRGPKVVLLVEVPQNPKLKETKIVFEYNRPILTIKKDGKVINILHSSKGKQPQNTFIRNINAVFVNNGSSSGTIFRLTILDYPSEVYVVQNCPEIRFDPKVNLSQFPLTVPAKETIKFPFRFSIKGFDLVKPDQKLWELMAKEGVKYILTYTTIEGGKIKIKSLTVRICFKLT